MMKLTAAHCKLRHFAITGLLVAAVIGATANHGVQSAANAAGRDQVAKEQFHDVRTVKILVNFARAINVVEAVMSFPRFQPSTGLSMVAQSSDNTIIVTGTDDQIRNLKEVVRLVDVKPDEIGLKAEMVVVIEGPSGRMQRFVFRATAHAFGNAKTRLRSTVLSDHGRAGSTLTSGVSDITILSKINGDNSIEFKADWEFDFVLKTSSGSAPKRVHNSFSSSRAVRDGRMMVLNGLTMKSRGGPIAGSDVEVLLYITPTIVEPRLPIERKSAIILDFMNRAGPAGEPLVQAAGDSAAEALKKVFAYEVVDRNQIDRTTYKPPYSKPARAHIASFLGATIVITGEIVEVRRNAAAKTTFASVRIHEEEAVTGETIGRGDASYVEHGEVGEVAVRTAVIHAAELAVGKMLRDELPIGWVLAKTSTTQDTVVSLGTAAGVKPGMEMVVLRDGLNVGRVRVKTAFGTDSEVQILENPGGIREDDRVQAVYSHIK